MLKVRGKKLHTKIQHTPKSAVLWMHIRFSFLHFPLSKSCAKCCTIKFWCKGVTDLMLMLCNKNFPFNNTVYYNLYTITEIKINPKFWCRLYLQNTSWSIQSSPSAIINWKMLFWDLLKIKTSKLEDAIYSGHIVLHLQLYFKQTLT